MYLSARSAVQVSGGAITLRAVVFLLLATLVTACASLPGNYPRSESRALKEYQSTSLGRRWAAVEVEHPGESGFSILRYGNNAFSARIGMVDLAEKTIDIQVYIWEPDETGQILAERLVRAADRGVRVRLLVDDMGLGASDDAIAALDAHPNIEIRIFNPFANRENSMFDFVTDLGRVNHRMHNKTVIVDNACSIIGGRNIADHYFAVDPDTNFRDLDIIAVGPVVRDISNVFDHFWRGNWSVPIAVLVDRPYTSAELQAGVTRLRENIEAGDYPYSIDKNISQFLADMAVEADLLTWAPGRIGWDNPGSIQRTGEAGDLVAALRRKLDTVQASLTIESAYFVVGESGLAKMKKLVDRGVRVRVLTNSLVSNDVLAAHAGHASYREQLLEAGVEVYELRADSGVIKKHWKGESRAGLHTKAMVFDEDSVFIGSFNLDPRSSNINTEAGLYVESPELAIKLLAYMDEGVLPENSYQLLLDDDGDLFWVTEVDGVEVRYEKDPLSTFPQRLMSRFIGILPIESQL